MCRSNLLSLSATLLVCVSTQVGCQSLQLENHTMRQAKTLTDLQYRQVLDNLAMFSVNPGSLPFFSAAGTGQTNVSQAATANFTPSVDLLLNPAKTLYRYYADKYGYGVSGTQTNLEQWTTASVLNPDELKLMQCVYQKVLGFQPPSPDTCDQRLMDFFKNNLELWDALDRKWLCVGLNGEKPPREAAFVGRYNKRFVWVMPQNVGYLSRVTLAILDIATALPTSSTSSKIGDKGAKVKALQDQLTALSAAFDKYPDKSSPQGVELKRLLDKTISDLNTALVGTAKTVKDVLPKAALDMLTDAARNQLNTDQQRQEFAAALDTFVSTPEPSAPEPASSFTRDRKNLYNPFAIPFAPSFP